MKKTSRLVMLAVALVLTLAMSTTTAFAWFTMNDVVTVNSITGTATADEGLLISKTSDGIFRSYVDMTTANPLQLTALTPRGATTDATPGVVGTGVFGTDIKLYDVSSAAVAAEGNYFEQDFYFQSDVAMNVNLVGIAFERTVESTRTVRTPDGISASSGLVAVDLAANAEIDANILNALRVAIFDGSGKLLAVFSLGTSTNDTKATGAGTVSTQLIAVGDNVAAVLYKQIMSQDAYAAIDNDLKTETYAPSNLAATVSMTDSTATNIAATAETQITLTGSATNYTGSCKIVIWVEGTDGDCINSILDETVEIGLKFKGVEVVE